MRWNADIAINPWADPKTGRETAIGGGVGSSVNTLTDINSAAADRLQSLSGIGVHYAKRIVAGRPYQHPDELVKKRILPQHVYRLMKDRIVARPS